MLLAHFRFHKGLFYVVVYSVNYGALLYHEQGHLFEDSCQGFGLLNDLIDLFVLVMLKVFILNLDELPLNHSSAGVYGAFLARKFLLDLVLVLLQMLLLYLSGRTGHILDFKRDVIHTIGLYDLISLTPHMHLLDLLHL